LTSYFKTGAAVNCGFREKFQSGLTDYSLSAGRKMPLRVFSAGWKRDRGVLKNANKPAFVGVLSGKKDLKNCCTKEVHCYYLRSVSPGMGVSAQRFQPGR
jgi:hypothetical protein